MAKNAKSKSTTALLSLDYCTTNEAAKLVNCKVKHILQLASSGKISLMMNFDELDQPVYGYVTDKTGQAPDRNGNIKLSRGRAWYGDIAVTEYEGVVTAKLGGIWSVIPACVYGSKIGKPSESLIVFASPDILTTSNNIEATAEIHGVDIPYPSYLISNENLTILKQSIESQQTLPCNTDPQHPANNPQNHTHPNELVAQNADLAEQLRQARDEKASLVQRLQQAEKEIAALKANAPAFRHMTPALVLVAEVQERYWGNTREPDKIPKQATILHELENTHGLSNARAKNVEYVASPIDRATGKRLC